MTRIRLKWIFNIEQDIEYFPVVDGVVDVFILLRGRQPSVAGPLENDRVGVLQMGSPGHSDTLNTRLQLNISVETAAEETLRTTTAEKLPVATESRKVQTGCVIPSAISPMCNVVMSVKI